MEYRVLARKYRPTNFDDLIGQEVLVRTLSNAIERGRVAHAFLLHGIRGIGKTTTARIIAKGLNCIGVDGQGGPTVHPCGECANCVAITQDRHIDVIEMDAASRTGVDDIREIIETIHYAPGQARTKVYIIDEVHMLSKSAFNALLKTLEEPPENVKFVFATTELKKIPVTILSRCQKFDLRRVDVEELTEHLTKISKAEKVEINEGELKLIAAAAEGSVRDALSMLDQAIALGDMAGEVTQVPDGKVSHMLGLAERNRTISLLENLFGAKLPEAIEGLRAQYADGNDPALILQELLERVHELTLIKTNTAPPAMQATPEFSALGALAEKLSVSMLTRSWQILAKGVTELAMVSNGLAAAEMILIRLAHAADLPDPTDLIRKLKSNSQPSNSASAPAASATATSSTAAAVAQAPVPEPVGSANENSQSDNQRNRDFANFESVVKLFTRKREVSLAHHLTNDASLVRFEQGVIELNFIAEVPRTTPSEIAEKLTQWSGSPWVVMISQQQGASTLKQQKIDKREAKELQMREHPLAKAAMEAYPDAKIVNYHYSA